MGGNTCFLHNNITRGKLGSVEREREVADKGVEITGKMEEASSDGGGGGGGAETGRWFKPKGGNLNPQKKKLVKTMMMEMMMEFLKSTLRNIKDKRKVSPHGCGSA
ncbi:hypothetical protein U1Q18_037226 [Sarracenia purpurea var. burkii]